MNKLLNFALSNDQNFFQIIIFFDLELLHSSKKAKKNQVFLNVHFSEQKLY